MSETSKDTSWLSAERPLSALKTLRFGFFALLSYDLWTIALSHAPRYGVASFNAAHLTWLDQVAPPPTPEMIGALYLASGALALSVAVGLAGRVGVTLCALIYSVSYFWSQADSYQHHYLLCLFLALFTLTPWLPKTQGVTARSTSNGEPSKGESNKARAQEIEGVSGGMARGRGVCGVGVSALMWQLSLIYAWTALAKCDVGWLSGDTLNAIINDPSQRDVIRDLGAVIGFGEVETYRALAWGVMLGEWFAALAVLLSPLRSLAFLIVPWFHISVELVGFDIELFSYYMLLLNLTLLSPHWLWRVVDTPLTWAFGQSEPTHDELTSSQGALKPRALTSALLASGSAIAVWWMVSSIQIEGASLGGVIGGGTICLAVFHSVMSGALTRNLSLAMSVIIFGLGLKLGVAEVSSERFRFDYYRLWGGDLKRRGELERAYQAYQIANQAQAPDLTARFVQLGDLATRLNKPGALEAYREGARRRTLAFERARRAWSEHGRVRDLSRALSTDDAELGLFEEVTLRDLQREVNRSARSATQAIKKLLRVISGEERAARRAELIEVSRGALEVSAQWATLLYQSRSQKLSAHIERFEARIVDVTRLSELSQLIKPLRDAHRAVESSLRDALQASRQLARASDEVGETLTRYLESRERELSEMWGALSMSFDALREQLKLNEQ